MFYPMDVMTFTFTSVRIVILYAVALRLALLLWGTYQDKYSSVKYTDIDYYVFTDATRYVYENGSPYERETYRYTPLLSWFIIPTVYWFTFGKVLFAAGDVVAGWLIYSILLLSNGVSRERALKYSSTWLLNPVVAQISTRGSSEGLLGVFVIALLWAAMRQKYLITGMILGFVVHFKIFPFIYGLSILCAAGPSLRTTFAEKRSLSEYIKLHLFNRTRLQLVFISFISFMSLNLLMFTLYKYPFIEHSFLHHFTRLDHRHNFSIYNIALYQHAGGNAGNRLGLESVAFIPQLLLSTIIIPLALHGRNLATTMFAQTFAFVTFNKVCTSQYFLWYLVLLPFYLPISSFVKHPRKGFIALSSWILGQALWLQQGYNLEFLGASSFVPQMWAASVVFFSINASLLGMVIADIAAS